MGIEYTVRLDKETDNRLQSDRNKIGSATKNGVVARLLDRVIFDLILLNWQPLSPAIEKN